MNFNVPFKKFSSFYSCFKVIELNVIQLQTLIVIACNMQNIKWFEISHSFIQLGNNGFYDIKSLYQIDFEKKVNHKIYKRKKKEKSKNHSLMFLKKFPHFEREKI